MKKINLSKQEWFLTLERLYMEILFGNLVLNKIKKYLVGNDLFLSEDFRETRKVFKNLSQVSRKFSQIFDFDYNFRHYFESKLIYIAFWPYQKGSADSDFLQPICHDRDMIEYIYGWRACPKCLNQIVNTLVISDRITNPVEETKFLANEANLFFCSDHFADLDQRQRIKHWQTITFRLQMDSQNNLIAKIQIIIRGPPSPRRWC